MGSHIDTIINSLGYSGSPFLLYKQRFNDLATLSIQTAKVLNELSPYAAYMIDNSPFIMFFDDESATLEQQRARNRKIWNAQIPVVFFCGTNSISIHNGYTIEQQNSHLTEIIKPLSVDSLNEDSPFSYWDITSRNFWETHSDRYKGKKLNDALLDNLKNLTGKLKKDHHLKSEMATRLVLRVIFIRYLIDRGVALDYSGFDSDVSVSRKVLLDTVKNKQKLYALFAHLKGKFNGNLFDLSGDADDLLITENVLSEVADFLSGKIVTKSGQICIYDMYDFNIIPVELISNIYEILLGAETRNKDNAFYTPHYLVDYILDNTIYDHIKNYGVCKVLDPACGSGIFLVESYRRMVEQKLIKEPFTDDDQFLQETLAQNIFGIDLNEEAIDVAIFSLYLAVLDYKNPKTLQYFQLPPLKGKNLLNCDFFNESEINRTEIVSQTAPFDFILGNPPWGKGTALQSSYCQKYKKYMQNSNDTCRAFILRSKDFCRENTKCCFILKSTMLYLRNDASKRFRGYLLNNLEISRVIELSSVREHIFKGAVAPAIIFSYKFSNTSVLEHYIQYISMKPNIFFCLFNIVVVEKTDIKYVQQCLLKQYDWAWKTIVYGFADDIYTISALKASDSFQTVQQAIEREKLSSGTGVKYNDGKMDASHLLNRPLLDSRKSIAHFSLGLQNFETFSKKMIDRTRSPLLFEAPYCLLAHGLDMDDYTMRSVYAEKDFIFTESIFAIKGSFEQKAFLLNATGLLNSKLYSYFNLMLGSRLGIEREERKVKEVLKFPYIYDETIVSLVDSIQQKKEISGDFIVAEDISNEIEELNRLIFSAFNLVDNIFVDYALRIQIPQLARKNDEEVYRDVQEQDFKVYGKRIYDHFSMIFAKAQKHIHIKVYPKVARYYSAFEVSVTDFKPHDWIDFIYDCVDTEKILLTKLFAHQVNGQFYHLKDVLYFEESSFCIIKPRHYKNWHPAIAQLDLMEAAGRILSRNGGEES